MRRHFTVRPLVVLAALLVVSACAWAYERGELPEFDSAYQRPTFQTASAEAWWQDVLAVGVLFVALVVATWIALRLRSRKAMIALSIVCLAYFGFYREGCVCPIGAIQNVASGIFDTSYVLPWTVVALFLLPLVFALVVGRVFCAGVCPLGAMQDLVLIRPVRLPRWLAKALRTIPYIYLGAAVLLAATGAMFIICRYDPFVPFFRLAGPLWVFIAGGIVLALSTFIGRPYCSFLCPYGALLGLLSRVSWKNVTITPDECITCHLCEDACPFGAIEPANARKEDEA